MNGSHDGWGHRVGLQSSEGRRAALGAALAAACAVAGCATAVETPGGTTTTSEDDTGGGSSTSASTSSTASTSTTTSTSGTGGEGGAVDPGACPDGCAADAECVITPDGSQCECKAGYEGDGQTCTDVDECAMPGACDVHATCTNEPGTFSCACDPGFSGDGTTCSDVDECAVDNGGCDPNATCTNSPGGFACACNPGFTGNGTTCADVDECAMGAVCDVNATCTNSPGSFACVCNAGYVGNGTVCVTALDSGLLDIDFASTTTKVGAAAVGIGPSDVWNAVGQGFATDWVVPNLVWHDGTPAFTSIHGVNLPGEWGWSSAVADSMYDSFLYSWSGDAASLTLVGLPAATYDVLVYGTSGPNNNSGFFVTVHDDEASPALSTTATKFTSAGPDANAPVWVEDGQYVLHGGVVLSAGQVLRVNVVNGVQGTGNAGCIVNGLQLVKY